MRISAKSNGVSELQVESHDWLADTPLKDLNLEDEGILILGIHRKDGEYVGAPRGDTKIRGGDTLVLYGRTPLVEALDTREKGESGNRAHQEAVNAQRVFLEDQQG